MAETNQEIEAQLQALTDVCCRAIDGSETIDQARTDQLVKALLMSGYAQKSGQPLSSELESRVRTQCKEPAMHRGAEVKAVTEKVQAAFDKQVRWESSQPQEKSSTKAANISSATDA